MKKFLAFMLAIILVFALCSCGDTTVTTPDDSSSSSDDSSTTTVKNYVLTYSVDGDNAIITGLKNDTTATSTDIVDGNLIIPSTIDGYTVVSIGVADAWDGAEFNTGYFTKVTLPDTVTYIAECAFEDVTSLEEIVFADNCTSLSIGGYAFQRSGLTTLTIPAYVDDLAQCAFCNSSALTTVKFLSSTPPTLGRANWGSDMNLYGTFMGCSSLTSITVPKGCLDTYKTAFSTYYGLYDYSSDDPDGDDSYWIDKMVEGDYEGVSSSTGDSDVTGDYVYTGTLKLSVDDNNNASVLGLDPDATITDGHLIIPETYGDYTITMIGDTSWTALFANNDFTQVTIPSTIAFVSPSAFQNMTSLKTINFPSTGSVVLGEISFSGTGIESLYISAGVTQIAGSAFQGCTSLKVVEFAATTAPSTWESSWTSDIFSECTALTLITVPQGSKTSYEALLTTWTSIIVESTGSTGDTSTGDDTAVTYSNAFNYNTYSNYCAWDDLSNGELSLWYNTWSGDSYSATGSISDDVLSITAKQPTDADFWAVQLFGKFHAVSETGTYTQTLTINSSVAGNITIKQTYSSLANIDVALNDGVVYPLVVGENTITLTYSLETGWSAGISMQFGEYEGSPSTIGDFTMTIAGFTEATAPTIDDSSDTSTDDTSTGGSSSTTATTGALTFTSTSGAFRTAGNIGTYSQDGSTISTSYSNNILTINGNPLGTGNSWDIMISAYASTVATAGTYNETLYITSTVGGTFTIESNSTSGNFTVTLEANTATKVDLAFELAAGGNAKLDFLLNYTSSAFVMTVEGFTDSSSSSTGGDTSTGGSTSTTSTTAFTYSEVLSGGESTSQPSSAGQLGYYFNDGAAGSTMTYDTDIQSASLSIVQTGGDFWYAQLLAYGNPVADAGTYSQKFTINSSVAGDIKIQLYQKSGDSIVGDISDTYHTLTTGDNEIDLSITLAAGNSSYMIIWFGTDYGTGANVPLGTSNLTISGFTVA